MKRSMLWPVVCVVVALGLAAATRPLCAQQSFSILTPEQEAADNAALSALETVLELEFAGVPLSDVAVFLSDRMQVPFRLDLAQLPLKDVSADSPVSGSSKTLRLKDALSLILEPLGLDCVVKNGMVLITTSEKAQSTVTIRVYPVKDLVGVKAGGDKSKTDDGKAAADDDKFKKDGRDAWGEELTSAITTVVAPATWRDDIASRAAPGIVGMGAPGAGGPGMQAMGMGMLGGSGGPGGPGAIAAIPSLGVIVVAQTRDVHEKIAGLLTALRAARAAQ